MWIFRTTCTAQVQAAAGIPGVRLRRWNRRMTGRRGKASRFGPCCRPGAANRRDRHICHITRARPPCSVLPCKNRRPRAAPLTAGMGQSRTHSARLIPCGSSIPGHPSSARRAPSVSGAASGTAMGMTMPSGRNVRATDRPSGGPTEASSPAATFPPATTPGAAVPGAGPAGPSSATTTPDGQCRPWSL